MQSSIIVLHSDGGNVELVEIDGPTVYLRLQGACGSCPSSTSTMTMGIRRKLQESIPVSDHNGSALALASVSQILASLVRHTADACEFFEARTLSV